MTLLDSVPKISAASCGVCGGGHRRFQRWSCPAKKISLAPQIENQTQDGLYSPHTHADTQTQFCFQVRCALMESCITQGQQKKCGQMDPASATTWAVPSPPALKKEASRPIALM